MVTTVPGVYGLFDTCRLSSATIQQGAVTEEQRSTLFSINVLIGVMLALVCTLTASRLVHFYRKPRLF